MTVEDEFNVDAALTKLREMFPDDAVGIEETYRSGHGTPPEVDPPYRLAEVDIHIGCMVRGSGTTIVDAMREVREWKEKK